MPFSDQSEVFGMHENAEITSGVVMSESLLSTVLSLQPKAGGGGGVSIDDIIKEKCSNILEKMPKPFDINHVAKKYPIIYEESMNTVLQQELIRFNNLNKTIQDSLILVNKAIEG